ncbi:hypothetical protein B0H14DRAFT_3722795 [Mycena olivaceomarginata]|nr:hypothetical protein B0H14DRAFT_3722795 [Mycena olivaceomarginata]
MPSPLRAGDACGARSSRATHIMCAFLIPISIHHLAPLLPLLLDAADAVNGCGGASGDRLRRSPSSPPVPAPTPLPSSPSAPHTRGRFRVGERRARVPVAWRMARSGRIAKKPKSMSSSERRDGGKKEGGAARRGCGRGRCGGVCVSTSSFPAPASTTPLLPLLRARWRRSTYMRYARPRPDYTPPQRSPGLPALFPSPPHNHLSSTDRDAAPEMMKTSVYVAPCLPHAVSAPRRARLRRPRHNYRCGHTPLRRTHPRAPVCDVTCAGRGGPPTPTTASARDASQSHSPPRRVRIILPCAYVRPRKEAGAARAIQGHGERFPTRSFSSRARLLCSAEMMLLRLPQMRRGFWSTDPRAGDSGGGDRFDIRAAGMGATGMTLPASRKRDTGEGKHNGDEVDVVHPMRGRRGGQAGRRK